MAALSEMHFSDHYAVGIGASRASRRTKYLSFHAASVDIAIVAIGCDPTALDALDCMILTYLRVLGLISAKIDQNGAASNKVLHLGGDSAVGSGDMTAAAVASGRAHRAAYFDVIGSAG